MGSRTDEILGRPLALALLWAGAVAGVALLVGRYWIPLDDGSLAQSAERVLGGQLPHRDFGDPYTGLNAMLGAAAFKAFGIRLASLRVPLVAGFALWLPAVWLLARRHLPPTASLAATVLAATLSVLAYPAAMPTWFGLFAVTWGVWMLARGLDGRGRGWLASAGAMAGVAVLFKVVGLYFLAAALLALAWNRVDGGRVCAAVVTGGAATFLLLLGWLVLPGTGVAGAYHFLLPATAACGALVARAWSRRPADGPREAAPGTGLRPLLLDAAALAAGALAPIALFLGPYAASGSLGAWAAGVFLLPGRRLAAASSPPGDPWTVLPGVAAVLLAIVGARLPASAERRAGLALAALLALGLALDDTLGGAVMAALWYSARGWIPALVVAVLVAAARRVAASDARPEPLSPGAFALLATAGLWSLVQFPYAAPAYFFYVAPLGVLATGAAVSAGVLRRGPVLALLAAVYLFLGAGYVAGVSASGTTLLGGPRGGIRVSEADASLYGEVAVLVRSSVAEGGLWAGPDAPEVYFLAGVPNPTPTLYEFLDPVPRSPEALFAVLDSADVRVVVVNTRPLFSPTLDPATLERIVRAFPESRATGPFVIRWRERP
ncbi:MAG: glycosyltransferase family 39 protein [Longimicrobiales bacterium]|nr:glycosyltransferase family 39 protein [Longimicrobiales bacterium]